MGSSYFNGNAGIAFDMPINDRLFVTQSDIIKSLADEAPAVFIGRCSDYVLRGYPNLLRIFIIAPLDKRAEHIAERHDVTLDKAKDLAVKTDKRVRITIITIPDRSGGEWRTSTSASTQAVWASTAR